MIKETEIKRYKEKLEQLTGFISEYGDEKEFTDDTMSYANSICDSLSWILGEEDTDSFISDAYLDLPKLELTAKNIELRSGKKLSEYK
jgi:hypothetical protein